LGVGAGSERVHPEDLVPLPERGYPFADPIDLPRHHDTEHRPSLRPTEAQDQPRDEADDGLYGETAREGIAVGHRGRVHPDPDLTSLRLRGRELAKPQDPPRPAPG